MKVKEIVQLQPSGIFHNTINQFRWAIGSVSNAIIKSRTKSYQCVQPLCFKKPWQICSSQTSVCHKNFIRTMLAPFRWNLNNQWNFRIKGTYACACRNIGVKKIRTFCFFYGNYSVSNAIRRFSAERIADSPNLILCSFYVVKRFVRTNRSYSHPTYLFREVIIRSATLQAGLPL